MKEDIKMDEQQRSRRKDEHVTLAYGQFDANQTAFQHVRFMPQGLPNFHKKEVSLQTNFAGQTFDAPFYINAMTGGSAKTKLINQQLAIIARETGLAMAVGSQSAALRDTNLIGSYQIVRAENPDGPIFANLSADNSVDNARRAVDMIGANALQIHINVAQEIIMKEGDRDFSNWLTAIEKLIAIEEFPVIVKEVGFGMSRELLEQLQNIGAQTIDIGGKGGTNFAKIETNRRQDEAYQFLEDWGLSTVESLLDCQNNASEILASGGIKTPLDILKCLALGAKSVGIAGIVLHQLKKTNTDQTIQLLLDWKNELKGIMTLLNAKSIPELARKSVIIEDNLRDFAVTRHINIDHLANRT